MFDKSVFPSYLLLNPLNQIFEIRMLVNYKKLKHYKELGYFSTVITTYV